MIGVTIQYILWTVDCLQAIHFSYESYYVTTEIHALFPYVAMNEGAGRESSLRQPRHGRRRGNTEFTSLYLAYEALPDETRETQRSPAPLPLAMLASLPTPNRISSTENCPRSDR